MVTDDELVVRQDSDMSRHDSIKSHIILSKEPSVLSISCGLEGDVRLTYKHSIYDKYLRQH